MDYSHQNAYFPPDEQCFGMLSPQPPMTPQRVDYSQTSPQVGSLLP